MTRGSHAVVTARLVSCAPDIRAYFMRRVGAEDAMDLLSETLLAAWKRVGDAPDDDERTRMWLFGIARRVLLNHARGNRRRDALTQRAKAVIEPSAPGADQGVEVRDAISRLAPDLAEIVTLVHWEGMTLVQCAEVIGIPASTARGRYQRARERLRRWLS